MERPSAPVNLLILTSRQEEAESIIKTLRNGGLAVRGTLATDPLQLEDLANSPPIEFILCCEYDSQIDLQTCMTLYQELNLDIPLVVIADAQTDSSDLIGAMRHGARDLTEHGDTEHLQLVVARELADLKHRRASQQLRERLHECEQRAQQAMDASGEAVAYIQEGMHVRVNPAYRRIFGFATEDDLDGYPLLDLIVPEQQGMLRQSLRALDALDDAESVSLDLGCVRADDSRFDAEMVISKSNLDGDPCVRALVQERDASNGGPATQPIDTETGLPDRTGLMKELTERLAPAESGPTTVGVIYVGVNIFPKLIQNETLTSGLEAMAAFGACLRALAPPEAFVARVCDDGFVLLLDDAKHADTAALSSKIVADAELPLAPGMLTDGERLCDTGAMIAEPGTDLADDVLNMTYRDYLFGVMEPSASLVPSSGLISSVQQSSDSGYHSDLSEEKQQVASRIHRALIGDGFHLVYQPIISLKGDSQENYNVFIRLRDDERRLREAKEFLAAAVQSGHMVAVDRWVIQHTIEEVVKQRERNRKINFFVNVAEESLLEEKLLIWICDYLRQYEARGNWLTFQVLEDHARRHSAAFTKLSEGLKKVKCRVAVNRFGLGPNPDVLLKNLRADFVKFAPELGTGLADDEKKQKRVLDLAALSREAKMRSVVTGVEDARTLTILWTAGIDYVQGNFLQKPSPSIEPEEGDR